MTQGIIYYNRGTKALIRLAVSVASLRRCHRGPVSLLHEGALPDWFNAFAADQDVQAVPIPSSVHPLVQKAALWRWTPYGVTLYLDADTLVQQDPSELFESIRTHSFAVTRFSEWVTTGRRIRSRLASWRGVVDDSWIDAAIAYGPAVNTGVFGFVREASILEEWEATTRRGWQAGRNGLVLDEIACQILLPRHPVVVLDETWNRSVVYGQNPEPAIVHYHGRKHCHDFPLCENWKSNYWILRRDCPALASDPQALGDRRLSRYVARVRRPDLTIVSACDRIYAAKLAQNLPRWMATPGIREQDFLVFVINAEPEDPGFAFLKDYPNVRVEPWRSEGGPREAAFTAFVFGVAQHVRTAYWMKLDADVVPVADHFEWPDYRAATLTAHRWGYTRVKGDTASGGAHWLNRLDSWWGGDPIFPPHLPPTARHRHKRIASFCAIERTSYTRRLAARCGDRLPVPSQDTTSWYAATRWNEPIARINMKRWLRP